MFLVFAGINIMAFLVMLWDKTQSRKTGAERISEGLLFFMATLFGSIGVYLGMLTFRHKTRKWYFIIGIPMLILENLALLSFVARYL
ncbi:MAG: DUF1294 domain-containing protein [Candidatus Moranbacteria bacterium]|nr:DUF1294 domain-containing protein [Candidatus Moranbacteria bacterium]